MAAEPPDLWPRTGRDRLLALANGNQALADYLFDLEGQIAQFTGSSPDERDVLAPTTFLQHVSFEGGADLAGAVLSASSGGLTAYANGYTLDNDAGAAGSVITNGSPFPFVHDAVTLPPGITHPSSTTYNLQPGTYYVVVLIVTTPGFSDLAFVTLTIGGVPVPQGTFEGGNGLRSPALSHVQGGCLITVGAGGANLQAVNSSGGSVTVYNSQDGANHEVVCGITILKIA